MGSRTRVSDLAQSLAGCQWFALFVHAFRPPKQRQPTLLAMTQTAFSALSVAPADAHDVRSHERRVAGPRGLRKGVHETAPARPLIELSGIAKRHGDAQGGVAALRGIDLRVEEGEFIALTGGRGAGKSTLLNIIGALDSPDAGTYAFRDVLLDQASPTSLALLRRFYIGLVQPDFHPRQCATVQAYVEAPLLYRDESAVARRVAATGALEAAGLAGWEQCRPTDLSAAQQRRAAVARALVTRPALLLADAPEDRRGCLQPCGEEFVALLDELNRERGITIIAVLADAEQAAWAKRVLHLAGGRIESDTRPG